MSEKKESPAKIILNENGNVRVEGNFNPMTLIGILEHELAYQKARLQVREEDKLRKKTEDKNVN